MDFVAQTSERSGLILRKIGRHLLPHLGAVSAVPVATSTDGSYALPSRGDQELAHQQQLQRQEAPHVVVGSAVFPSG